MKIYKGERKQELTDFGIVQRTVVTVDGKPLDPRNDLWNHSPTGFEWGYAGSDPAQLALAILSDFLGKGKAANERAIVNHQAFKFLMIAQLPREGWTIKEHEVRMALAEIENERAARKHYKESV